MVSYSKWDDIMIILVGPGLLLSVGLVAILLGLFR